MMANIVNEEGNKCVTTMSPGYGNTGFGSWIDVDDIVRDIIDTEISEVKRHKTVNSTICIS